MTNTLFATRLPKPTLDGVRDEARRQRRNLNTIVDAGLRHFLTLPESTRDALALGEPMPDEDRQKLGLSDFKARGQRRANGKRGVK